MRATSKVKTAKKFCYTYPDIAKLLNLSVSRVKHLVSEGKLKPTLQGIAVYYDTYTLLEIKKQMSDAEALRSEPVFKSKSLNNKVWETE